MTASDLTPTQRNAQLVFKAGIFVAIGLVLATAVVFVIGRERDTFSATNTYHAAFNNIEGLQVESPVRLGGLTVGKVKKIGFSEELEDRRIMVTIEVSERYAPRIRADSIAKVTSRGVLGDKAIDITMGSPEAAEVAANGELKSGSASDLSALLERSGAILENATAITTDLREGVAAFTSPQVRDDVTSILSSVRSVAQAIEKGPGVAHTLLYDAKTSEDMTKLIARATDTAAKLDSAADRVDGLLAQVQKKDNTLHRLFYDEELAQAVAQVGQAAGEVATLVHDARNSKSGAVHQLVYGDASGMLADLGSAAANVKELTSKIRRGEGSLGAIINDPTVYEDLKQVLGNVKRNRVLRALVRMSASKSDELEHVGQPQD